jgi:hypothetical protein
MRRRACDRLLPHRVIRLHVGLNCGLTLIAVRHYCVKASVESDAVPHVNVRATKTRERLNNIIREMIMKIILSAIVALSVLTGVAASASAANFPNAPWADHAFTTGQGAN